MKNVPLLNNPSKKGRVSIGYFLLISMIAVISGAIVGMTSSEAPDQHPRFEFADGEKIFCSDEGRIDISSTSIGKENSGFTSPEEAVSSYVSSLHFAAMGGFLPENHTLSDEILALLEPSRQFQATQRQDISENLTYFDLPSNQREVLEARIVVERTENGFYVSSTYICEAQLVSDPIRFEQLWAEEVGNAN